MLRLNTWPTMAVSNTHGTTGSVSTMAVPRDARRNATVVQANNCRSVTSSSSSTVYWFVMNECLSRNHRRTETLLRHGARLRTSVRDLLPASFISCPACAPLCGQHPLSDERRNAQGGDELLLDLQTFAKVEQVGVEEQQLLLHRVRGLHGGVQGARRHLLHVTRGVLVDEVQVPPLGRRDDLVQLRALGRLDVRRAQVRRVLAEQHDVAVVPLPRVVLRPTGK